MLDNDIHNDLGHITLDAAWGRRIAQAMAFANSTAWSHVAQIVLIDPFTAGVGVGGGHREP